MRSGIYQLRYDPAGCDDVDDRASRKMTLEQILRKLYEEDPRLVQEIELKAAGYSVEEISQRMGISTQAVYRDLKKIRSIAEPYHT